MSATATKKPPATQNQKLSFAQKFDPSAVRYGIQTFAGQLSPRTFGFVNKFSEELQDDRTNVEISSSKAPSEDRRVHTGWSLSFNATHVSDASSFGREFSRLECALFSALWVPPRITGHSSRGATGVGESSALVAARRQLPVLFNELHMRSRLRLRLKSDETPAEKFMSLMGSDLVCASLLYLEAAKMEVFAGRRSVKIAIPMNEGLLLGDLQKGKLPETKNMIVVRGHKTNNIKTEPCQDYDHHLIIRTWVDGATLNKANERIYQEIEAYGNKKETDLAMGSCQQRFLGIHSTNQESDDPRMLKMMTDNYIRVAGNKYDRADIEEALQGHKVVAERATRLSEIAVWADKWLAPG